MTYIETGRAPYQKGNRPGKSKPIRNASRGMSCTLALPGICTHDPETVVGAHLRVLSLAGMGQKPDDLFIVDACHACHSAQESRAASVGWEELFRALVTTQQRRRAAGLVHLEGEE